MLARSLRRDVGGGLSGRRVWRLRHSERQQERPEAYAITIVQPHAGCDLAIADKGAVLAAKIFDPGLLVDADSRMPARDGRRGQLDDIRIAAAEQVLAVEYLDPLAVPDEPAANAPSCRLRIRRLVLAINA